MRRMWWPRARRADRSDLSDDLQFLFVVTYGRSGSTLLMSLLDSLPGYCIRGENAGVTYDLFEYHRKALEARDKFSEQDRLKNAGGGLSSRHPWYGIDDYPEDEAIVRLRELVVQTLLRPPREARVTGFKEIRWWMPKLVDYLDFLDALFPGARYVLNTRNLDDVSVSKWYRRKPDAREKLQGLEERLVKAVDTRGDRGYHLHFDDYVNEPSMLKDFYAWLGEPYDERRIRKILEVQHSF